MNAGVKAGPGGWAWIEVPHGFERTEVRARLIGAFSVHRRIHDGDRFWTVTHTRTGGKVRDFVGYQSAVGMATALRDLYSSVDLDSPSPTDVARRMKQEKVRLKGLMGHWGALPGNPQAVFGPEYELYHSEDLA